MDKQTTAGVCNRKSSAKQRRTANAEEELRKERRRHRRRCRDSYDDEEKEEEGLYRSGRREEVLPKWKLYLVGAAIFLCFAMLYPSVFAPMLSNLFGSGGGGGNRQHSSATDRVMHPSMMGPNPQQRDRAHRPPPHHPGASMRMPADMHQQQHSQGGGGGFWGGKGGGSLAWMLPFYTVGVVCFLLYTLFKTMFKSKSKRKKRLRNRSLGLFHGEHTDDDDEDDEGTADEDDDDDDMAYGSKLRTVQKRLHKTEQAMAEILSQLEQISAHSQNLLTEDGSKASQNVVDQNRTERVANAEVEESDEHGQQQQRDGQQTTNAATTTTTNPSARTVMSEKQSARVEQSLRELKMLSELCKNDRRLRRKLRTAAAQPKRHHSSSPSSSSSLCSISGEDYVDEEEEEEEEDGQGTDTIGKEGEEEMKNGYGGHIDENGESNGRRTDQKGGEEKSAAKGITK